MLVEQFVMLSAVQWESFLNDLIIAYVMMRPQAAINSLETKIGQLVAEFAKKFSLNKSDAQFIDFAVTLRNFLGHRNEASRKALKGSVSALSDPPNAIFKGQIRDVGTYLKTKDGAGTTRAIAFASRLIAISAVL